MSSSRSLLALLHYRGRCSRTGFIVLGALLLAVQFVAGALMLAAGLKPDGPASVVLSVPLFWLAFTALVRRLHDVGHTGWWVVGAIVASMVWTIVMGLCSGLVLDPRTLTPEHIQFWSLVAIVLAPPMSMLLWIHAAPGMTTANRHGPPPEGYGFVTTYPGFVGAAAAA
ncbi:MAG: DUF805 domain-containing protein [Hyphomicrobiaceae bacterium]